MKSFSTTVLFILSMLLIACEENENFQQAASLKVVHAIADAPPMHVNYFNQDINYSNNSPLSFGANERYTLRANETTSIVFVYISDTTREAYTQEVALNAGGISTLFLTGDSANVSGVLLKDQVITNMVDSLFAVRFINLSQDAGPINIHLVRKDEPIASSLIFGGATTYVEFGATAEDGVYTFEFRDSMNNMIASFTLDPLRRRRETVFKNLTLALIGQLDNDSGGNSLSVTQINNF